MVYNATNAEKWEEREKKVQNNFRRTSVFLQKRMDFGRLNLQGIDNQ
jgi:hypothetical protein